MKIAARIRDKTEIQGRLFDEPLGNHGHRRYVIGELCETLTASVLRGSRFCYTGGAGYVPDIYVSGHFLECKAVGRSRSMLIYSGRLAKDAAFVADGNSLFYAVWHHTASTLVADTVEALRAEVLMKIQWMAIVPFRAIEAMCLWMPSKSLNSKYGKRPGNEYTYGAGYRIPLSSIEPWAFLDWEISRE